METIGVGGRATIRLNALLADPPELSVTATVKLDKPLWVGVPLRRPVGLSHNPDGRVPD
jgi:hypothetical protein